MKVELLQKFSIRMWKDVSAKYRVIERFKEKYPIQKMCELFEVSRSGFYKWRKRVSQPQQRGELDQFIIECQAQVNQSYGYRRVCLWIKQNKSVEYHPLTVLHHMQSWIFWRRSGADGPIHCINRVAIAMRIC